MSWPHGGGGGQGGAQGGAALYKPEAVGEAPYLVGSRAAGVTAASGDAIDEEMSDRSLSSVNVGIIAPVISTQNVSQTPSVSPVAKT